VFEDPFANTESAQANSFESEFSTPTETVATPMVDAPFETPAAEPLANFSPQDFAQPDLNAVQAQTKPVIEGLRSYSEKSKESAFDPGTRNPYHLIISGPFDPFSRDKLLVFITENSVGISSSDLDFQINAGKVLFPRVSEFSAIKLTQDLRDTGLTFQVFPSSRDEDEMIPGAQSLRFEYRESSGQPKSGHGRIPVLPLDAAQNNGYKIIDSIQMVQYLRAEILEVEKSDLFQELLDRMTNALKRRAEAKGAEALTSLAHKVTALRLPSQYQVELSATLLKKL
jgi:hypothetical protein